MREPVLYIALFRDSCERGLYICKRTIHGQFFCGYIGLFRKNTALLCIAKQYSIQHISRYLRKRPIYLHAIRQISQKQCYIFFLRNSAKQCYDSTIFRYLCKRPISLQCYIFTKEAYPPDPMNHANIFEGQPRRFALCQLVPTWYKSFSSDHSGHDQMNNSTILSNKTSTA